MEGQNQCLTDLLRLEQNSQVSYHSQNDESNDKTNDESDDESNDEQGRHLQTHSTKQSLEHKIKTLIQDYADASDRLNQQILVEMEAEIDHLQLKLAKMDTVNLNAIEDYEHSLTKLNSLNEQSDDITQALETLKKAIYKIDHKTKDLFKTTFDALNEHFSEYFPTLFGGGSARLVLTEDDLLNAGVIIDAKPFGKRNKQVSMLSGGEKALTAVALVFSFFSLNPAPFCMLDEVDAPLDDYNTQKFNELIAKKSSEVQFICITHNKLTMQSSSQLLGVTMKEPGASKVVSVDINKAIELAG